MIANGRILFVKFLSDAASFGMDLAVERDGLIRRAVNSFARYPTNQVGKLRRIGLVARIFQFSIECLVSGFVADVTQLAFENGNLGVMRVCRSEFITLITNWDGLLWEIRDIVGTKAGRDVALRGFLDRGA